MIADILLAIFLILILHKPLIFGARYIIYLGNNMYKEINEKGENKYHGKK